MPAEYAITDPRLRLEPGPPGSRGLFLTHSLPDAEKGYEVIGGSLVPKPLTVYDVVTGNNLLGQLGDHLRLGRTGHLVFGMLLDLPGVADFYRPEVAFVPYLSWPPARSLPAGEAWSVVPALVVEVAGSDQGAKRVAVRVTEYLRAGASAVWIVRTDVWVVHQHTAQNVSRVLNRGDELVGDPVVPGFRVALTDLFPLAEPTP